MPKQRVQVSKDKGQTWKFRWIDPTVLDPDKTLLEPGDYIITPKGEILVLTIKKGLLQTKRLESSTSATYHYIVSGKSYSIEAISQSEADYLLVQQLIKQGEILRSSNSGSE
ncbi:hypothetical protein RB298_19865 [Priestia sp. BR_2]